MKEELDNILRGRKFKKMLDSCFEQLKKQHGLKQIEVEIMLFLDAWPEGLARDICRMLDLNKGHVSQALLRLQNKGFLTGEADPQDKRSVHYSFTGSGTALLEDLKKCEASIQQVLLDGITEEELMVLEKVAGKIEANMDKLL